MSFKSQVLGSFRNVKTTQRYPRDSKRCIPGRNNPVGIYKTLKLVNSGKDPYWRLLKRQPRTIFNRCFVKRL